MQVHVRGATPPLDAEAGAKPEYRADVDGLRARDTSYLRPTTYVEDERIRTAVAGTPATFVSPVQTFCNGDGCLLVIRDGGEYLVMDDWAGHLTAAGAIYFLDANSRSIFGP